MADTAEPMIPDDLLLDQQLCFALQSASGRIQDLYRPLLAEHDLSYAQYAALMALAEVDGVSITQLAERLGVTKATMTPLLRRLAAKSLITRQMQAGSERQKSIQITAEGRTLLGKSCLASALVFARSGLSPDQAEQLIALCQMIAKA